jgi:hypothetical protein
LCSLGHLLVVGFLASLSCGTQVLHRRFHSSSCVVDRFYSRRVDLELATRNYRAAHIRSKAAAGFKVYADTRSGRLAAVLDDHNLIAELLRD